MRKFKNVNEKEKESIIFLVDFQEIWLFFSMIYTFFKIMCETLKRIFLVNILPIFQVIKITRINYFYKEIVVDSFNTPNSNQNKIILHFFPENKKNHSPRSFSVNGYKTNEK